MPATAAQIGLGSRFGIRGEGDTYSAVAEVTRITLPGWTRNSVDATHLESPDGWAEFIPGLKTASDCTFEMNWVPAAEDPMLAAFNAGTGNFQCIFPNGATAIRFAGMVTSFTPGEVSPEGKLSASVTIKPTGAPVFATVTP